MPVWTEAECRAVVPHVFAARQTAAGLDVFQERFELYGGIARTVFSSDSSDELFKELVATISSCKLRETIRSIDSSVKQLGASHKLLHLKVDEANYRQTSAVLVFASERVSELVLATEEAQHVSETIDFLGQAVNNPHLAGLRGTIFEWHAHAVLAKGGKFRTRRLEQSVEQSRWITFKRRQLIVVQDLRNIGDVSPTSTTTRQLRQRRWLMNVSACLCGVCVCVCVCVELCPLAQTESPAHRRCVQSKAPVPDDGVLLSFYPVSWPYQLSEGARPERQRPLQPLLRRSARSIPGFQFCTHSAFYDARARPARQCDADGAGAAHSA